MRVLQKAIGTGVPFTKDTPYSRELQWTFGPKISWYILTGSEPELTGIEPEVNLPIGISPHSFVTRCFQESTVENESLSEQL